MHKVSKILLFILLLSIDANAQNKYAVLIGINDYYTAPGVKHGSSLHGCVNDAKSMKGLLENRFGFNPANIITIFNEQGTKRNIIEAMHSMLMRCEPGDALVFYYSGHGAWMTNIINTKDPVKDGMSQSMVMSNLYAPDLECLFTDEMLKQMFNQFVDKKVTVTALFDCCYSGNLAMGVTNSYWKPFLRTEGKGLFANVLPYVPRKIKPTGCRVDSSGRITESLDSDHDGVPDCKDWEVNSPPFVTVDSLGVTNQDLTAEQFIALSADFKNKHSNSNQFVMLQVQAVMKTVLLI